MSASLQARSVSALLAAVEAGEAPKYLFFWGHTPRKGQSVGPWVLSQWYPSTFEVEGRLYRSAEHWMMARKAELFGDAEAFERVFEAEHPGEAKRIGRQVRGFCAEQWEAHRFEMVVEGNVHKFGSDPSLSSYLMGTRGRVLVEAAPRDRIWGVGLGAAKAEALGPAGWRGANLLGFALMEARSRLRTG